MVWSSTICTTISLILKVHWNKQQLFGISGAARGFAHIGAIKALEAQGIVPDMIVGTSVGAVVGAFAANLRGLVAGSPILESHRTGDPRVQDPYSIRCMPQVHGATRDALAYVRRVLEIEINSVTDNPLVLTESGRIVSGGNFHGQPLAIAFA